MLGIRVTLGVIVGIIDMAVMGDSSRSPKMLAVADTEF